MAAHATLTAPAKHGAEWRYCGSDNRFTSPHIPQVGSATQYTYTFDADVDFAGITILQAENGVNCVRVTMDGSVDLGERCVMNKARGEAVFQPGSRSYIAGFRAHVTREMRRASRDGHHTPWCKISDSSCGQRDPSTGISWDEVQVTDKVMYGPFSVQSLSRKK